MKKYLIVLSCFFCCCMATSAFADKEISNLTIDRGNHFGQDKNGSKSNNGNHFGSNDIAPVPEPATILLVGTALAGVAAIKRKKKK